MKKLIYPALVTSLIALGPVTPSMAQNNDTDILGDDFNVTYDGEFNLGGVVNKDGDLSTDLSGSFVSLSVEWKHKVRAVITAKIEEVFEDEKLELNDDFSLGKFIQEAYIEIREVGGSPVAVVVGKQPIPFSQNIEAMPFYENNPLHQLQDIDEVYGFTVNLTEGLFGLFDQAEISTFETDGGNLSLGKIDGVSIRLSRMITRNWLFTLGHASLGNDHLDTSTEKRTSLGLIGQTDDGVLVGWVEGMYFSNNPEYMESNYGVTAGAMVRVHRSTDIVVEYSWIENELQEIGVGVRTALTESFSLGAEIRYRSNENSSDEIIAGVVLTYTFGNTPYSKNYDYLFGGDDYSDYYMD